MLKIIPTPENPKVLYTLPGERWEDKFEDYEDGIYFEYSEDDVINFQFFYVLGKVSILEGSFSSTHSSQEMEAFFDCCVSLEELWTWLDQIPFKIVNCKDINDPSIKGIWKMDFVFNTKNSDSELLKNYYEFKVSTVLIRSIPYNCWSMNIIMESSDNVNKIYWFTLCLLKFQRQSKQPSGE